MKKHQTQPVRRSNRITKKTQENGHPANSTDRNKKNNNFSDVSVNTKTKNKRIKILEINNDSQNNEIHSDSDNNLFFSNKSSQKKLDLPIQLNNINENRIITETSMRDVIQEENENFTISGLENKEKNYFQFLESQKLTNESDFYSNSEQEPEDSLENQYEFSYEPLLSQETFSQDEGNILII